MYIIKPQADIVFEGDDVYSKIENIGRICYKSEDLITSDSHKRFISNIVKRGHESVIEHHHFVLRVSNELYYKVRELNPKYLNLSNYIDPHTKNIIYLVSGNARAFKDMFRGTNSIYIGIFISYLKGRYPVLFEDMLTEVSSLVEGAYIEKLLTYCDVLNLPYEERRLHHYISVKFICDRGISHEIVRHRTGSFSQESSRYCNYGKGKYDSNITIIDPLFYDCCMKRFVWWFSTKVSEWSYMILVKWLKSKPEEARSVLNNSLKTELIMTTNVKGWENYFDLRISSGAHPQVREVSMPLYREFTTKKYIHKKDS